MENDCPICDRPDCQRFARKAEGRKVTSRMYLDCQMRPVDWRARALAAEGRLRTLERMLLQADNIEIEWDAPNDRWQFAAETGRAFPTIEGCLDAWAAEHKEAPR